MNCLEFRRRYDTAPGDAELTEHRRTCQGCSAFAQRAAELEHRLSQAFAVPVPENLSSRVLMRQAFACTPSRWRNRRAISAVAASLLIAVAVFAAPHLLRTAPGLGHEVVTLIGEAEHALAPAPPVTLEHIRMALNPVGIDLDDEIGVVTFAGPCVVRGKLAGHLVMQGERAPITVLLMPHESVSERLKVDEKGLVGVVLPTSDGAIAIVGARGEALERLERKLRHVIRWSA